MSKDEHAALRTVLTEDEIGLQVYLYSTASENEIPEQVFHWNIRVI